MALFSTSCSGGGSPASLRLLQASPDAPPVNVLIDGVAVAFNLAYGNDTGYLSANPGSRHVQVVPASGGGSPIFDQTISLVSNTYQTLLLTGPAAAIQPVRLDDTAPTIVVNSGYVRVVNASATMGAADAYLVPAGSSIVGVKPVAAGMTFDQSTGYQVIVAGNYQVFMTSPGTATALLSTGPLSLTLSQNQTVVALDGVPGGFTYVRLTDQ